MRSLIALITVMVGMIACTGNGSSAEAASMTDSSNYTTIQWLDSLVNFDTINMGEKTTVSFRFKNTGDKALYVNDVKASCGCTVADYTKGAIAPGQEGKVTGSFDSNKSHPGEVRKNILVTTNTRGETRHKLIFAGVIREKPSAISQ